MRLTRGTSSVVMFLLLACALEISASSLRQDSYVGSTLEELFVDVEKNGLEIFYSQSTVDVTREVLVDNLAENFLVRLRFILKDLGFSLIDLKRGGYLLEKVPTTQLNLILCHSNGTQPISDLLVQVNDRFLITDYRGQISIDNAMAENLVIPGFEPATRESHSCDYVFVEDIREIEELVVSSNLYRLRSNASSLASIHSEDFGELAEAGSDALRVVNRLPGMASLGISAKPYIRGGTQDEVMVIFNDVQLIDPFHLKDFQSLFSGLDPAVIDSVDVFTGGFPARYGNRLSGVMDIKSTFLPDQNSMDINLNFYNTGIALKGGKPDSKLSWLLSARRGNLDLLLDQINPSVGKPKYRDSHIILEKGLHNGATIQFGYLDFADDIRLFDLDDGEGVLATSLYDNSYQWFRSEFNLLGATGTSTLSQGVIENTRHGDLNDPNPDGGVGTLIDNRNSKIARFDQRFYVEGDRRQIEIGFGFNRYKTDYSYSLNVDSGELAVFLGGTNSREVFINDEIKSRSWYGYVSARYLVTEPVLIETGLRWDEQREEGGHYNQFSPRLRTQYQSKFGVFGGSAGRYFQPEATYERQPESGRLTPQTPQRSDQFTLSWQKAILAQHVLLRASAYYKKSHKPKFRYENLLNFLALVPELQTDRVLLAPEEAVAKGLELSFSFEEHNWRVWSNATVASVTEKLPMSGWTPRAWDQRYTFNGGVSFERSNWGVSAAVTWHNGWRTSRTPSQFTLSESGAFIERNQRELPNYFSLDVRYHYTWKWPNSNLTFFAEIINATDRANVGSVEAEVEAISPTEFSLKLERQPLIPLAPSIGLNWTYNF